ncbi:unnamed protein product [Bursaphelenchus okinawaensis]|uniref:DNA/pantothenate metabolism flavoprotein C-terminal domain-containing protein n=1 Tax=Bursaphelenchus okinawaensis TaxID=465554 RepID=A0A811L2W6_9BILA|nr:unnamed protein product [Bursaphelenchus okinawaensis]CAG9115624.1 unnamed protein product [Bursaphelenchus okinawaensis]
MSNVDVLLEERVEKFVEKTSNEGRRLALITSGGTIVPLEKNTVRFIDNFSQGTRGSASSEYFLKHGYNVIFFYRENSLKPFSRHAPNLFEQFVINDEGKPIFTPTPEVEKAIVENKKYGDRLLFITFTTVEQYLHEIELICKHVHKLGPRALIYLAAAVSDFYIKKEELPTHKIQSKEGDLQLRLSVVTKILDRLVTAVVPQAFLISFKLETDPEMLIPKAQMALKKYGHSLVIANMLANRKTDVTFVQADKIEPLKLTEDQVKNGIEIEQKIIEKLCLEHGNFLAKKGQGNKIEYCKQDDCRLY